jgi:hypothetical protein
MRCRRAESGRPQSVSDAPGLAAGTLPKPHPALRRARLDFGVEAGTERLGCAFQFVIALHIEPELGSGVEISRQA